MHKSGQRAMLAGALAIGAIAMIGGSTPARADVCDQLTARIAYLSNEENQYRGWLTISEARGDPASLRRDQNRALQQTMARRRSAERQYAKKNCGDRIAAQRMDAADAAAAAATGAALGAIGFGILSGSRGRSGYSGSSGYSPSGRSPYYGGRSGYGSSGGSGYRR